MITQEFSELVMSFSALSFCSLERKENRKKGREEKKKKKKGETALQWW
jgi:hypothetical protein